MCSARPILTIATPDNRRSDMDEQLVELESRIAFQDQAIHSLSETVAAQQQQIDALNSALKALREKLKALEPSPIQSNETEPPPPHY
ncbi:MAG: hypothetical protein B6D71_16090 [gamma proteobacterium symbiont of Stewartia floridana]|nr:MAG: hypothetical protein B6D71_16090 [gamma proteobacterium symbiont of Stewartia floridana]